MDKDNNKTRREFLEALLVKGTVAAGLVCIGLSPESTGSGRNKNDIFSLLILILR
jgi:hypothetical protein